MHNSQSEYRIVIVHGLHSHAGIMFDECGTKLVSAWGETKHEALIRTVERLKFPGSAMSEYIDQSLENKEGKDLTKEVD